MDRPKNLSKEELQRFGIPVPKGWRAKKKKNKNRAWRWVLFFLDPHCFYCRLKLKFAETTLDHRIPVSKGGGYGDNVVLACEDCNQTKDDRSHTDQGEKIRKAVNAILKEP